MYIVPVNSGKLDPESKSWKNSRCHQPRRHVRTKSRQDLTCRQQYTTSYVLGLDLYIKRLENVSEIIVSREVVGLRNQRRNRSDLNEMLQISYLMECMMSMVKIIFYWVTVIAEGT